MLPDDYDSYNSGSDVKKEIESLRRELYGFKDMLKNNTRFIDDFSKSSSDILVEIDKDIRKMTKVTKESIGVIADGIESMKKTSLITSGGYQKAFAGIGSGLKWRISEEERKSIESTFFGKAMFSMLKYYKELYVYFPALGYAGVKIFSRLTRTAEQYAKIQLERQKMLEMLGEEHNGWLARIYGVVSKGMNVIKNSRPYKYLREFYRKSFYSKRISSKYKPNEDMLLNATKVIKSNFIKEVMDKMVEINKVERQIEEARKKKETIKPYLYKKGTLVKELMEVKGKYANYIKSNPEVIREINKMFDKIKIGKKVEFPKEYYEATKIPNYIKPIIMEGGTSNVPVKPHMFKRMFGSIAGIFFAVQGILGIVKVMGFIFGIATKGIVGILKIFTNAFGLIIKPLFDIFTVLLAPIAVIMMYVVAQLYKFFVKGAFAPWLKNSMSWAKHVIKHLSNLYNTFLGINKWMNKWIVRPLKIFFSWLAKGLGYINNLLKPIGGILGLVFPIFGIINYIKLIIGYLQKGWARWVSVYNSEIKPAIKRLRKFVGTIVDKVKSAIAWIISLPGKIRDKLSAFIKPIKDKVLAIYNKIVSFFGGFKNMLVNSLKGLGSIIANAIRGIFGGIGKAGNNIINGIKGIFGFQTGGYVMNTGLYKLHAGETVLPRWSNAGKNSTVNNYEIHIDVSGNNNSDIVSEIIDRLRIELGLGGM